MCACTFQRSEADACRVFHHEVLGAGTRRGSPKPSSPTTLLSRYRIPMSQAPIKIQGKATCSERPGSCSRCHGQKCRRLVTIRAGDGAVTTIRQRQRCPRGHLNPGMDLAYNLEIKKSARLRPRTLFARKRLAIVVEAAHISTAGAIQSVGPRPRFW